MSLKTQSGMTAFNHKEMYFTVTINSSWNLIWRLFHYISKAIHTVTSKLCNTVVTTRIRRMGKVLFSQVCVCPHQGWGLPHLHPIILPLVTCPFQEVPLWLVTGPFLGGYPSPSRGIPWPGLGYPPPPKTEQQSEHLLHGGRYASCVHAGGLSC